MKIRMAVFAALCVPFVSGCESERYDDAAIAVEYISTLGDAELSLDLSDGTAVTLSQFGIAIGHTELVPCENQDVDAHEHARLFLQKLGNLIVTPAFAHSANTPFSNGTPIVLATGGAERIEVPHGLEPPAGTTICAVRVVLHPADHDAVELDTLPDIEGSSSASQINDEWVFSNSHSDAWELSLPNPIVANGQFSFEISLNGDKWTKALQQASGTVDTAQQLHQAATEAALNAFSLAIVPTE